MIVLHREDAVHWDAHISTERLHLDQKNRQNDIWSQPAAQTLIITHYNDLRPWWDPHTVQQ